MNIKTKSTAELTTAQVEEAIARYLKHETGVGPTSIKFNISPATDYSDYTSSRPAALTGAVCVLEGVPTK